LATLQTISNYEPVRVGYIAHARDMKMKDLFLAHISLYSGSPYLKNCTVEKGQVLSTIPFGPHFWNVKCKAGVIDGNFFCRLVANISISQFFFSVDEKKDRLFCTFNYSGVKKLKEINYVRNE